MLFWERLVKITSDIFLGVAYSRMDTRELRAMIRRCRGRVRDKLQGTCWRHLAARDKIGATLQQGDELCQQVKKLTDTGQKDDHLSQPGRTSQGS